jgi:serine carboxypeptidase-like clade 2
MPKLNLVGFLVGNAWTQANLDNLGAVDFWLSRTAISQEIHDGIISTCNMSDVGPLAAGRVRAEADWEVAAGITAPARPLGFTPLLDSTTGRAKLSGGASCDDWTNQGFGLLSGIDIYDMYDNVCPSSSSAASALAGVAALPDSNNQAGCAQNFDPCRDDKTTKYLNTPAVKAAIHANASITWSGCSSVVNYSRFDLLTSMIPVYQELIAAGLRILVYSGDVDAIVPSIGSRSWISALGTQVISPIRAWSLDGQVGGWTTQYAGLNFTTVRGAGHFVPEMQGSRALAMFNAFIANVPL